MSEVWKNCAGCDSGGNYMRIYIVQTITNSKPTISKISQEGFITFDDARNWCRNKPGIKEELQNGWMFITDDYEYRIHDVIVR